MNTLTIALLRLQIAALLLTQSAANTGLRAIIAITDAVLAIAGRAHARTNNAINYHHASACVALQIAHERYADQLQRGITRLADELVEIVAIVGATAMLATSVIGYVISADSGMLVALVTN